MAIAQLKHNEQYDTLMSWNDKVNISLVVFFNCYKEVVDTCSHHKLKYDH